MMTAVQKDWEVLSAAVSPRNGDLYVHVTNHCAAEIDRDCWWHINSHSITSDRYDWSHCEFKGDARRVYDRMVETAQAR